MFPASPLPNWQVLGADRRVPVPPPPAPSPHSWLGGHSHQRWRVESLSVAPRDASQHTRPDRLRRALPPPPSEASLGLSGPPRPGSCGHLRGSHSFRIQGRERRAQRRARPPRLRSGVACSSQMPLSLPAELELNHRGALLEPCAATASAAARARHAAPEQMTTGLASRDSALRTRPPPPPPAPRRPRALLCLRQRTQREPPRSLPTARASQASPPRLRPIRTPRVFPPPPRDPHLRIGERRGPT